MKTIIASIIPKLPPLPWTPTSYVLSDQTPVPKHPALPATVIPIDPMVKGRPGVLQNNWRLVMAADALFLDKRDDHLLACALRYGLTIFAPMYSKEESEDLFASLERSAAPKPEPVDDDPFGFGEVLAPEPDLFAAPEPDLFR